MITIGVDFDNTIVCYDGLFYRAARDRGLIPPDLPNDKNNVRNYLRKIGKEDAWTELQGYVYGPGMEKAVLYPGVADFFKYCRDWKIPIYIISHRTRTPFLGPACDLHDYARRWLKSQGFYEPAQIGFPAENVFFELTKEEKLLRISQMGCTLFIDDLPEFLLENNFPAGVQKILFAPTKRFREWENELLIFNAWNEFTEMVEKLSRLGENHEYDA